MDCPSSSSSSSRSSKRKRSTTEMRVRWYRFQPSLTHDVLFSVVQSVSEHSGLVAAKAAIGNWIVAYALSKVVVIQSLIRRWLVCRKNREFSSHLSESITQIQLDDAGSNNADHDDIAVLTASEVASAVSRINYCSREFRAGVTFSGTCNKNELKWSGQEHTIATQGHSNPRP